MPETGLPQHIQLSIVLLSAFLLCRIPVLGKILKVLNTWVHESAHALASLFTSGEVESIDLFHSGEGLATTRSGHWLGKVMVSLAGYTGASAFAFLSYWLIAQQREQWILYAYLVLGMVTLIFWVRNTYGVIWVMGLLASVALLMYVKQPMITTYFVWFCSSVILIESMYSAAVILYISLTNPKKSGDAKNLQQFTYIPALFWGLFFFTQALIFSYLSLRQFLSLSFVF
jgi:hypothetical protein